MDKAILECLSSDTLIVFVLADGALHKERNTHTEAFSISVFY